MSDFIHFDYIDGLEKPDADCKICRVYNSLKANKLYDQRALYFSPLEGFRKDDDKEGVFFQAYLSKSVSIDEGKRKKLAEQELMLRNPLVSCWGRFDEAAGYLQEKFGNGGDWCCAVTTPRRLLDSIRGKDVIWGNVAYVDEEILARNSQGFPMMRPVISRTRPCTSYFVTEFMKRSTFSKESEVRFVVYPEKPSAYEKGVCFFFDIDKPPFDEIIIGPEFDDALGELLKRVLCEH